MASSICTRTVGLAVASEIEAPTVPPTATATPSASALAVGRGGRRQRDRAGADIDGAARADTRRDAAGIRLPSPRPPPLRRRRRRRRQWRRQDGAGIRRIQPHRALPPRDQRSAVIIETTLLVLVASANETPMAIPPLPVAPNATLRDARCIRMRWPSPSRVDVKLMVPPQPPRVNALSMWASERRGAERYR